MKKIWSMINALLLVLIFLLILLVPERLFVFDNNLCVFEIAVIVVLLSNALFFLVNFILSFVKIQRVKPCMGSAIFDLLLSGFSILLLMVIKVMSDEIAREWDPMSASIWSEGEFFILLVAFLMIMAVQLINYIRRE